MTSTLPRISAGTPAGGQFAPKRHDDATATLAPTTMTPELLDDLENARLGTWSPVLGCMVIPVTELGVRHISLPRRAYRRIAAQIGEMSPEQPITTFALDSVDGVARQFIRDDDLARRLRDLPAYYDQPSWTLDEPIIVRTRRGEHVVVDGVHRFLAARLRGDAEFTGILITL